MKNLFIFTLIISKLFSKHFWTVQNARNEFKYFLLRFLSWFFISEEPFASRILCRLFQMRPGERFIKAKNSTHLGPQSTAEQERERALDWERDRESATNLPGT